MRRKLGVLLFALVSLAVRNCTTQPPFNMTLMSEWSANCSTTVSGANCSATCLPTATGIGYSSVCREGAWLNATGSCVCKRPSWLPTEGW
jgi:hypothetical protein